MNDTGLPSGRFVLRTGRALHALLRHAAGEAGLSLNEYCVRRLLTGGAVGDAALGEAAARMVARFGDALEGLVVFGSYARGEVVEGSDVDLLIVLERGMEISRGLYGEWDGKGSASGPRIEPHFVNLPEAGAGLSGFWAEIAIDGVVLFEREMRVSRMLAGVRRRIADGELVRRWAHGHPYWTEAA